MASTSSSVADENEALRRQVLELSNEIKVMELRDARHEMEKACLAEERDSLQNRIDILEVQTSNVQATEDDMAAKTLLLSQNEHLSRQLTDYETKFAEYEAKFAEREGKYEMVEEALAKSKASQEKIDESQKKNLEDLWKSVLPKGKSKVVTQAPKVEEKAPSTPVASITPTTPNAPNAVSVPFSAWTGPKVWNERGIFRMMKQGEPKTPVFPLPNFSIRPMISKSSPEELPTESPKTKSEVLPRSYADIFPRKSIDSDSDESQTEKFQPEPVEAEDPVQKIGEAKSKGFKQEPTMAQTTANPVQEESYNDRLMREMHEFTARRRAAREAREEAAELSSPELKTTIGTEKRKLEPEDLSMGSDSDYKKGKLDD